MMNSGFYPLFSHYFINLTSFLKLDTHNNPCHPHNYNGIVFNYFLDHLQAPWGVRQV